jgi:hypothetical protein
MLLTQTRIAESAWTVPLVSLLIVAMLALFHWVVSDATKAGETRRQATAAQAAAMMRCNALPSWDISKVCLKDLHLTAIADASIALAAN